MLLKSAVIYGLQAGLGINTNLIGPKPDNWSMFLVQGEIELRKFADGTLESGEMKAGSMMCLYSSATKTAQIPQMASVYISDQSTIQILQSLNRACSDGL
ncbi:MAG: hypothetical protein Q9193_001993 [Seirophora villosa]